MSSLGGEHFISHSWSKTWVPAVQDQDFSEPLCPPLCDGDHDLGLTRLMGVQELVNMTGQHAVDAGSAAIALLLMPTPLVPSTLKTVEPHSSICPSNSESEYC